MRAIFDGNYRLDQLEGLVADLVHNLADNGVQTVGPLNMYFIPIRDGHKMQFFDEHGSDVNVLRFDALDVSEFVPAHSGVQLEAGSNSASLPKKDEMHFYPRTETREE